MLTMFFSCDRKAFQILYENDVFGYIRKHRVPQINKFFTETFEIILKRHLKAIFHPWMYSALLNIYGKDYDEGANDPFLQSRMTLIFQEIFVSHYLTTKHRITPILTWSELHTRHTISSAQDSIPLHYTQNNSEYKRLLHKYFDDVKSFSELISTSNSNRD